MYIYMLYCFLKKLFSIRSEHSMSPTTSIHTDADFIYPITFPRQVLVNTT